MANYYCTARSNYFRVKDRESFLAWAGKAGVEVIGLNREDGLLGLLPGSSTDSGEFPSHYDEETDDEFDVFGEVSEHLTEGSVAVFVEAGAEKSRYVHGIAVAINSKNEREVVCISDIYEVAAKSLGSEVTRAEY